MSTRALALATCLMSTTLASPIPARGRSLEPITYTVRVADPRTHYIEVEARIPTARRPEVELMMAVWTPGSYLVREYARHVEAVAARTDAGAALAVRKTRKNRWVVTTTDADVVVLSYRVYCREMSVRTNWVEDGFAMLNGGPTFITLLEQARRRHDVTLVLPEGWTRSVTALAPAPDGRPHHYVAPDYDTLVDSPIVAGNPAVYEFEVSGTRHLLVNEGESGIWDGPRSARDVEQIVRTAERFWGRLPYDRYVFLNVISEAEGGLEHRDSTLMMTSRWHTSTRADYLGWLGLVSHEFFHAWNVKRLRPVELGPFDYESEVYTENLWVSEGFTDYYGELLLRRAGLSTRDEYLRELSRLIAQLQTTPGRLTQPASQASYDAWIRHYRPDENSPNVAISYYTKGGVIAFLLDAKIRRATNGARSLDDVMRLAYERYAGPRGFTTLEFRSTASEVAGIDLSAWFATAVDSTSELDYAEALDWLGLRFQGGEARTDKGWLGAETKDDNGRLVVARVRRGTPAYEAGLNVDDEILAIDGFRVRAGGLDARLERYRPGRQVRLLVARRDELRTLDATLGAEPIDVWRLEAAPDASGDAQKHLADWLWEN